MRWISLGISLAIVMALAACGAEETAPTSQSQAPERAAPEPSTLPEAQSREASQLLGGPETRTNPKEPASIRIDYIAEARRCLAAGDTEGYQAALKGYNDVQRRGGGGPTLVAVTANAVTWRTEDGQEYTTNLWHDALSE